MDAQTKALITKMAAKEGHSAFGTALSGFKDQYRHNSKAQDAAAAAEDAADASGSGKSEEASHKAYSDYWSKHRSEKKSSLMDRIVSDFIKGAQGNFRTGEIQMADHGHETKLASARLTPLDVAKLAGQLQALHEGGFNLKEASEMLQQPAEILQAVLETVR